MLFSGQGCLVVGFCGVNDLDGTKPVAANFLAWKRKTDKRILESSISAEIHAAIVGQPLSKGTTS
jgi:hypothetical protein